MPELGAAGLRVLVVDDEQPARDELDYLLTGEDRVAYVATAGDATEALRLLRDQDVDVVFLDIRMPGLDGVELARVLARFANPPAVVFVTAFEQHAVEAFELRASDYLLKPVRSDRLREALDRIDTPGAAPTAERDRSATAPSESPAANDEMIAVDTPGHTRLVSRESVWFVEACGDYARLHTAEGSFLVRTPISLLEERWTPAGFFRIHRSYLVALKRITEVKTTTAHGHVVKVGDKELPVSRRHVRAFKERLLGRARPGRPPAS